MVRASKVVSVVVMLQVRAETLELAWLDGSPTTGTRVTFSSCLSEREAEPFSPDGGLKVKGSDQINDSEL